MEEQSHAEATSQRPNNLSSDSVLIANIAGYLARYHLDAIRSRSKNIATGFPVPQNIIEFENYQFWELNAWGDNFRLAHGIALDSIAQKNAARIMELIEEAKSAPETAKSILKEAQVLKKQIDDAGNLLEKLNG